ncbi:hypothetical protein ACN41D_002057, partial [Neisseria gonorrhoeae]
EIVMSIKVDNILLIEGTKESVAEAAKLILFRSPVHPEHWAFDFNRILPLPENITSDLAKQRIEAWGSSFSPYPTETFVTQREGFIEICFLTGLAPPFGIYRKLAEIFANLDVCFTAKYINQYGSFGGRYEYRNSVLYHCLCEMADIRKFGIAEFDIWYEGLSDRLESDGYLVED